MILFARTSLKLPNQPNEEWYGKTLAERFICLLTQIKHNKSPLEPESNDVVSS